MKKLLAVVLLSCNITILFLSGCVPSKPTEEVEILPSERLIQKLEANRRRIRNFEGSGTFLVNSPMFSNNSATFRVVLQKPDSIYFTIMGPFGIELAQALVTNKNFVFYDDLHNTAYKGKVEQSILKDIFKIDLSFDEMMDSFIGSVNLTNRLYKNPDKYSVDYDEYVLTYIDSLTNRETIYRVDIRQLGITNYQIIDSRGNKILEGKYSDFNFVEGVAVPYKIVVTDFKNNQQISIDYKKMAANNPNIFVDFKIPDDATVIKW